MRRVKRETLEKSWRREVRPLDTRLQDFGVNLLKNLLLSPFQAFVLIRNPLSRWIY